MGKPDTRLLTLLIAAAGLLCALSSCGAPPPEPPPTPEERGAPPPGHYPTAAPVTTPYPAAGIGAIWGSEYANQFQNSRIAVEGPQSADLAWQSVNSGSFQRPGVIDAEGRLYFTAGRVLQCYNPQGSELWRSVLDSEATGGTGSLDLRSPGGVYVADSAGNVYAYAENGTRLWKYDDDEGTSFEASLAAGTDGNVYLTSFRSFTALSPEGSELWRFEAEDGLGVPVAASGGGAFAVSNDNLTSAATLIYLRDGGIEWSTPATSLYAGVMEGDGLVFALSENSGLMTFDLADGSLIRQSPAPQPYPSPRPIMRAPDGSLYVLSFAPSLLAYNSDGTFRSETPLDIFIDRYATMRPDGSIVLSITEYDTLSPPVDYAVCFNRSGTLLWKSALPAREMLMRPAPDGSVYAFRDNRIARFGAQGAFLWEKQHFAETLHRPLFDAAGNLYIRGGGAISSFGPDGRQRWRQPIIDGRGAISLGSSGHIYMQVGNTLAAYTSSSGARQWAKELDVPLDDGQHGSIVVGADGSFVSIVDGIGIYSFSADAAVRWLYVTDEQLFGEPAIGEQGNIYVLQRREGAVSLLALDRNGIELWECPADPAAVLLMLDGAGHIFTGGIGNLLSAISEDGSPLWSVNTGQDSLRQIAMGLEGPLALSEGDLDGGLRAYDLEGRLLWHNKLRLENPWPAAVDSAGRIYTTVESGFVACFAPDGAELWRLNLKNGGSGGRTKLSLSPDGSLAIADGHELTVLRE